MAVDDNTYFVVVVARVRTERDPKEVEQWMKMLLDDQGDDQVIIQRRQVVVNTA